MNQFLAYLLPDLRKGDLIKNLLFCSTEYSSSVMRLVGQKLNSIPEMITQANPILKDPIYYIKKVRLQNEDSGPFYLDSTSNHLTDGLADIGDGVLKMSCMWAVEKKRFQQFDEFGVSITINNKQYHLVCNKSILKDQIEQDEENVYFPTSKSLPLSLVRLTEINSDKEAGKIQTVVFLQRLHESNEKLVIAFWSVLTSNRTKETIYLGLRILNALMGLKGMYSYSVLTLPFKFVKQYLKKTEELDIIEGFTSSLMPSVYSNIFELAIKSINKLNSNPKQSSMMHLFAISASQQGIENLEETKSVLSMRDFVKKDYLLQVFNYAKDTIFKKVEKAGQISFRDVNLTLDTMISWTSSKTSNMGRFWKARILNYLIANCLMAFYIILYKKETDDFNPISEAMEVGKSLFSESKRYLEDLFISSGLFQKL